MEGSLHQNTTPLHQRRHPEAWLLTFLPLTIEPPPPSGVLTCLTLMATLLVQWRSLEETASGGGRAVPESKRAGEQADAASYCCRGAMDMHVQGLASKSLSAPLNGQGLVAGGSYPISNPSGPVKHPWNTV